MKLGSVNPYSFKYDGFVKAWEYTATEAQSSLTISGLNGDVDEEYILESKVVNGYNGACSYLVRPNNDTGTSYGYQLFDGTDSTASASRGAAGFLGLAYAGALNNIASGTMRLFAKSGFVRTCLVNQARSIATTVVASILSMGWSWNNTADNITSLVIAAAETGGIGVGSKFILYKKARKS